MFKGFQETGEDKIILGTPWPTNENPQIDWNERTIKIGMIASKDLGEFGTLRPSEKDSEKLRKRDTRKKYLRQNR